MYWHCEIEIGIAKLELALRNWNWHCEIEIGIAKLALRNSHCEIGTANLALRNFAKLLAMGLRNAQYPAATVPLVLHPAAHILLQLHLIFFTLPLIFH